MSFYQNFSKRVTGKYGAISTQRLQSDSQFITLAVGDCIQKDSGESWVKIEGYTVDGVVMKYNNIFDKKAGTVRSDSENDARFAQLNGNNIVTGNNVLNGNNIFNGTNKFTKPVTHTDVINSVKIENSDYINTKTLTVRETSKQIGWVTIGTKAPAEPVQTTNLCVYGTTELTRDAQCDNDLLVKGNLTSNGTLNVKNNANLELNLNVFGSTTMRGNATAKSDLTVERNARVNNDLHVYGLATIDKTLTQNGPATFNNISTFNSATYLNGDTYLNGNVSLNTNKQLTLSNIRGNPNVDNLTVNGKEWVSGSFTARAEAIINGDLHARNNEIVYGNLTVNGNILNNDNAGDIGNPNARFANVYFINGNSSGTIEGNAINFNGGTCRGTLNAGLFNGTATSARHADLAEKYSVDKEYEIGTVLQVNENDKSQGTLFKGGTLLGVVSEKPGLMINSDADGQYVALKGLVPVLCEGKVKKGQYCVAKDGKVYGVNKKDMTFELSLNVVGVALDNSKDGKVLTKI